MARDVQRSRVYRWERAFWIKHANRGFVEELTLDECRDLVKKVWRSERGRYGRPGMRTPEVMDGRRRRSACGDPHALELRLPRWSRNPWVVLHELAHVLDLSGRAWHGPRFVGILIGLASRHIEGLDGQAAVNMAIEMDVNVDVRSVGAIPVIREPTLADRIREHLPGRITQIAWRAGCRQMQVRGAAMTLIRRGEARYFRGRLVALEPVV